MGLCLAAGTSKAFAGAWTLDAGSGQVVGTATFSRADGVFDGAGNRVPAPRYNKAELQALIEYGVTGWLTAILAPGLQHIDIATPVDARRTGLGFTEAGARVRLLQGSNWVFSGQATVRVPGTGDSSNPAAIGYTGVEVDVRALAGYSFAVGNWPAFADLQVAQRFRGDGAPNEFRVDGTLGVRVAPRWMVLAQSFNVMSEGQGSALFPSYEYYKLQLSVVHDLAPNWAVQLGGFTTVAGRNALQENGVVVGIWYKFR